MEAGSGAVGFSVANFKSHKKIAVYDTVGNLMYEVNTQLVTDNHTNGIFAYEIISPDTIFVLPAFSTQLLIINRQGEIWKKV